MDQKRLKSKFGKIINGATWFLFAVSLTFNLFTFFHMISTIEFESKVFSDIDYFHKKIRKIEVVGDNIPRVPEIYKSPPKNEYFNVFFHPEKFYLGMDFFQFYESGVLFRLGRSIYHFTKNQRLPGLPPRVSNHYPPLVIILIGVPVSFFQPWIAYGLWLLINELALLACVFLLFKKFGYSIWITLSSIPWLISMPVRMDLRFGQINILIALLLILMVIFLDRKKDIQAAFAWGLGVALKLFPLMFVFAVIRKRNRWWIAGILTFIVAINFIYFLVIPQDMNSFLGWVAGTGTFLEGSQKFLLLLTKSRLLPRIIAACFGLCALFLTVRKQLDAVELLILWISVYFLAYTRIWEHHYIIYYLAVSLMMSRKSHIHLLVPSVVIMLPKNVIGNGASDLVVQMIMHFIPSLWLFISICVVSFKRKNRSLNFHQLLRSTITS